MAAEITLFTPLARATPVIGPVAMRPIESKTATFTAAQSCVGRFFANGAVMTLTLNGVTWTIPDGGIEYYGVELGDVWTVA